MKQNTKLSFRKEVLRFSLLLYKLQEEVTYCSFDRDFAPTVYLSFTSNFVLIRNIIEVLTYSCHFRFLIRLSPNRTAISSPRDYYASSAGDEENLEPRTIVGGQNFSRLSPNSVASPPSEYYAQNEENLEPQILSPYSGAGDSEEGTATVYATSPETFSGALYYKQEITETGEFMDVVSWWEQEQGRLVHQQHTQRLTHV